MSTALMRSEALRPSKIAERVDASTKGNMRYIASLEMKMSSAENNE